MKLVAKKPRSWPESPRMGAAECRVRRRILRFIATFSLRSFRWYAG